METEQANTAYGSTVSSVSAFVGPTTVRATWRSWTTTRGVRIVNARNGMRPVHPGEMLREDLDMIRLSANALSKELGVPVNRITILNGQRGVSAKTRQVFRDDTATLAEPAEDLGTSSSGNRSRRTDSCTCHAKTNRRLEETQCMAVPDFQSLMLPTLQALSVRAEMPISQVRVRVAAADFLTPEDLRETISTGRQSVFTNRVSESGKSTN